MTEKEYLRLCVSLFLSVMKPSLKKNYILFSSIQKNKRGEYTGKGVRVCRNDEISNSQLYSSYLYMSDLNQTYRLIQLNYRFRRRTLKDVFPHPAFLAG